MRVIQVVPILSEADAQSVNLGGIGSLGHLSLLLLFLLLLLYFDLFQLILQEEGLSLNPLRGLWFFDVLILLNLYLVDHFVTESNQVG